MVSSWNCRLTLSLDARIHGIYLQNIIMSPVCKSSRFEITNGLFLAVFCTMWCLPCSLSPRPPNIHLYYPRTRLVVRRLEGLCGMSALFAAESKQKKLPVRNPTFRAVLQSKRRGGTRPPLILHPAISFALLILQNRLLPSPILQFHLKSPSLLITRPNSDAKEV